MDVTKHTIVVLEIESPFTQEQIEEKIFVMLSNNGMLVLPEGKTMRVKFYPVIVDPVILD